MRCSIGLLLALLVCFGCGNPEPYVSGQSGSDNVETQPPSETGEGLSEEAPAKPTKAKYLVEDLVGDWTLDKEKTLAETLKAANRAAFGMQIDQKAVAKAVKSMFFEMTLNADNKFTCSMGNDQQSGEFSGTWAVKGTYIRCIQTHEGSERKSDKIEGQVIDGVLHMVHDEGQMSQPYVFKRK